MTSPGPAQITIVGLNNAGKTTILYKLCARVFWVGNAVVVMPERAAASCCCACHRHLGEVVVTQPTIGSNVEEINHNNVKFQVWDLGGQENLRPSWSTYFTDTNVRGSSFHVLISLSPSAMLVSFCRRSSSSLTVQVGPEFRTEYPERHHHVVHRERPAGCGQA